ncbi:prepilin-type N-terminal cleavage/methylation domain-containing protein [Methylonatrum kenyense]|uniref:PilW family protein n=1 Tax=Methylonatrum kenyense TaxID=455253 RepID=UPI0020C0DD12|nr:prepilin-type N-terminal cleavage/methylation domain-containing protein [Methylonatrum kenyense]MCK8517109.1 prepilin-type N-terminal cleavage/methylation domain-containing protein [Methylonatrum kenyense]
MLRRINQLAFKPKSGGFTLVELMVGLVVGLVAVGAIIALYITVIRGAAFVTAEARLTQETRIAMDLMAADIRRSGYSHPSHIEGRNGRPPLNPFMTTQASWPGQSSVPDGIRNIQVLNDGRCVMLSYDPTFSYNPGQDATWPGDAGTQFVFGYRQSGDQLEMLSDPAGDVNSTDNCGDSPPGSAQWVRLTDHDTTRIRELRFDMDSSVCLTFSSSGEESACDEGTAGEEDISIESRRVRIIMRADHATNPESTISFEEIVGVKNNRIFEP